FESERPLICQPEFVDDCLGCRVAGSTFARDNFRDPVPQLPHRFSFSSVTPAGCKYLASSSGDVLLFDTSMLGMIPRISCGFVVSGSGITSKHNSCVKRWTVEVKVGFPIPAASSHFASISLSVIVRPGASSGFSSSH